MKTLKISTIEESIDQATTRRGCPIQNRLRKRYGLSLRRARNDEDWQLAMKSESTSSPFDLKTPWFFGMVIYNDDEGKETAMEDQEDEEEIVGLVSFYVAYSTWNGRIFYLDQILLQSSGGSRLASMKDDVEQHILRIMASIAVDLDFARVTWRHKDTPNWHSEGTVHPEMHEEVLTLSMDQKAMKKYTSVGDDEDTLDREETVVQQQTTGSKTDVWVSSTTINAIDACLQSVNAENERPDFRLRLARVDDLKTISRLVQCLADYVKESDSVHIGIEDYRLDGYSSKSDGNDDGGDPLFYCLLLDYINKETGTAYTCGYAFCYFGYSMCSSSDGNTTSSGGGGGRFLYLEDLFLEVEYRQKGGGNLLMKTLARISLALRCKHLVWQALDWNTAGLQFYGKIGARILEGEKTSRFCGEAMQSFAFAEEEGSGQ